MRVTGRRRVTAALVAAHLAALVSAAPHDAYEDRHQPLTALDPSTFVDGTFSPTFAISKGDDASSADYRTAPFDISVRASRPRASGELECEDTVVVTVTARVPPSDAHWVASYSPPNANVTATAPTKYAPLRRDPKYLETGVSDLSFRLTCMRHAYDFVVFTEDWVVRQRWRQDLVPSAVAVARSEPVPLKNAAGPRAPRLVALAPTFEDATETPPRPTPRRVGRAADASPSSAGSPLAVAWSSGRGAEANPRLRWWVAGGDANGKRAVRARRATTRAYARRDLCGAPANGTGFRDPGFTHVARFGDGLEPGTRVEYELTDDSGAVYPDATRPRLAFEAPRALETGAASVSAKETSLRTRRDSLLDALDARVTDATDATDATKPTDAPWKPFSLALFADMGRGTDDDSTTWQEYGSAAIDVSRALTRAAEDGTIDAAFLFGDLSYAVGYSSVWDEFCEQITPWASRVPLLTNAGNHEFDGTKAQWDWARARDSTRSRSSDDADATRDLYGRGDSGGECGVPASVRFPNPAPFGDGPSGHENAGGGWFAATIGPFRVLSLNTEVAFNAGSAQRAFLESELSESRLDRTRTPFVVVVAHRPALVDSSFGRDGPSIARGDPRARDASDVGVALALQSHVWPLLVAHGVDVFVAGHNHAYQRHCAFAGVPGRGANRSGYFGKSGCAAFASERGGAFVYENPGAPVSLVVGTAGAAFTRHDLGAGFVETTRYAHGYLRLTAESPSVMRGTFVGADDEVFDAFAVVVDRAAARGEKETQRERAPRVERARGTNGVPAREG